ncbi:MAG: transporter substrate-binding protein [Herminiimonas sp.]|nr:transporter substrate-binding protein [Herminiimonas sp.]
MKIRHACLPVLMGLCFSSGVLAQTPVKMSLDFRFDGPGAGFLLALDKGYYKAEGLDVTIDPGNGSVEGINRVASGAYDIAVADINSLIRYRDTAENPPIKAIFMIGNAPAFAVTSLKKTGIAKPKDLEGKTVGAPAADGAYANWAAFMKASGTDSSKIRIENVGFAVREQMLAQGKVDAIVGFGYTAAVSMQAAGFKPEEVSIMYMRNYGLDMYGNALVAGPAFLRDKPDVARKFIRASIKGYLEAMTDPQSAIASVIKRNPVTTAEAETMRFRIFQNENFLTAEVKANGIGAVDPARFNRAIDQIGESFKYKAKPKMDDVYTESFLPPLADRKVPSALVNKAH